jgi:hypothetical protein
MMRTLEAAARQHQGSARWCRGHHTRRPEGCTQRFNDVGEVLARRMRTLRDHGVHVLGSFIFGVPQIHEVRELWGRTSRTPASRRHRATRYCVGTSRFSSSCQLRTIRSSIGPSIALGESIRN